MSLKSSSDEKIRSSQLSLDDLRKKIDSSSRRGRQCVEFESKGVYNKAKKNLDCDIRAIALGKSFQGNQVLKDVSVKCVGGTITAILGPSGSVKYIRLLSNY
jgi:ABC-type multidrug transport system fused ATPase/permease subunit